MASFREVKRNARFRLHERMAEPALYLATPTDEPVGVSVRLHLSFAALGELLRGGFGEREEMTPRIIFMGCQLVPARGGIVVTKDMGAWRLDNTQPADDISITAEVIRLTPSQCIAFGWDPSLQYMGLVAQEASSNPGFFPAPVVFPEGSVSYPACPGGSAPVLVWTGDEAYAKRTDFVSDTLIYYGEAAAGSAPSAAVWRIRRFTIAPDDDATGEWAGGTAAFDKVWDDRATLGYS